MSEFKIIFHRPPEEQRIGGLDLAIKEMAAALGEQGTEVFLGDVGPIENMGSVVGWFHGLWQPPYRHWARAYRLQGIPFVVSPHGMLEPWAMKHKAWKKIPYFYLNEKSWLKNAATIFSTGALEAASIKHWLPGVKVEDVPLGVASEMSVDYKAARGQLGWEKAELVLLYLSRIHPKKGLLELVHSLSELSVELLAKLRLVIVGDGPAEYIAQIRTFINNNKERLPQIDEAGPIWDDRKWTYLQGADLFCLPTYSENFGLAVLEALRVGTPVFTTDQTPWGSFSCLSGFHIASPGHNGISKGIRAALSQYKWSESERKRLANWSKSRFDWSVIAARYINVLEGIIANK